MSLASFLPLSGSFCLRKSSTSGLFVFLFSFCFFLNYIYYSSHQVNHPQHFKPLSFIWSKTDHIASTESERRDFWLTACPSQGFAHMISLQAFFINCSFVFFLLLLFTKSGDIDWRQREWNANTLRNSTNEMIAAINETKNFWLSLLFTEFAFF